MTALSINSCRAMRGSRGAEGGANAHLGLPPGRTGEQQVGYVRAGDEQHEADRRQQDERRIPHLRDDDFMEAPHPRRHVGVGLWSHLLGAPGDPGQLGLGLRGGDAGPQTPGRGEEARAGRLQLPWREIERQPELCARRSQREPRGHDADDDVRLAIDRDRLPDETWIRSKATSPQTIAEHRRRAARRTVRRSRRNPRPCAGGTPSASK